MTYKEFTSTYTFYTDTPIARGDLCWLYLTTDNKHLIKIVEKERLVTTTTTAGFEVGQKITLAENDKEAIPIVSIGNKSVEAIPVSSLSNEVTFLLEEIQKLGVDAVQEHFEEKLLSAMDIPVLDSERKLEELKECFRNELYDDAFKGFVYDYKDQLFLDEEAFFMLGWMCLKGKGVIRNKEQALIFLKESAKQGNLEAKALLKAEEEAEAEKKTTQSNTIKPPAATTKRPPSVKLQLIRYGIVAGVTAILTLGLSTLISGIISGFGRNTPTVVEQTNNSNNDEIRDVFEQTIHNANKKVQRFSNYHKSIPQIREAINIISDAMVDYQFSEEQKKKLIKLKKKLERLNANVSDYNKGLFWKRYKTQEGETTEDISARFEVISSNIKSIKHDVAVADERVFKEGTALKIGLPVMYFEHHVSSGDNLGLISIKYNIDTEDIKALNKLKSDVIHPDSKLKVFMRY